VTKQSAKWDNGVSIIVPTYKRPDGLRTAIGSLVGQTSEGRAVEIIIADNDPAASAKADVAKLVKKSSIDIIYVHVPNPGVSNARNGAMEQVRGRYVVFLDDDMEAIENWVDKLVQTSLAFDAGIVFGAISAVLPERDNRLNDFMYPYFSRTLESAEGLINEPFGIGGCLLDLQKCKMPTPPFNPDMNETGGEDDWLFSILKSQGVKMAWSPEALSYEHVPLKRTTRDYFWSRNFKFGQGPTQTAADIGLKGKPLVVFWMLVGIFQTVIFAPVYGVLKALDKPLYMKYMAKTAQGLGKILWWDRFSPRMYGVAAVGDA